MNDIEALRRLALAGGLLAIAVSVPSNLAFFAAFGLDLESTLFGEPSAILGHGPERATLLRWGAIGDMFYSYLLLIPLALFLHRRLRPVRPWLADLGAIAAFAYIFVGGTGAAILAIAGSSLVEAYSTAAAVDQPALATSFETVRNIVFFALWQMLDTLTLGFWVLSTGILLLGQRRGVSRLLVVLGVATMSASLMTMLGVHSLVVAALGLGVALLIWAAWLAVDRPRRAA
jgi:hypothetical protein